MKIFSYQANASLGVIFPAKTFIYESKENIYIISPGNLDDKIVNELKSSNKILHFIAPNNVHNLYLKTAKDNFPNALFFGPKRSMKVSKVELKPISELPLADLSIVEIQGHKALSETCFYIKETSELIITDLIFNMKHRMNFSTKLVMKMAGTYHRIGTSRLLKLMISDKEKFQTSLKQLLELRPKITHVNHGDSLSFEELERHIKTLL